MRKKIRRNISKMDLDAAARLKDAFNSKKKKLKLTQESFGATLGITQGSITQYLNGHIALNIDMLLRFCTVLEINPIPIYPELFHGINPNIFSENDNRPYLIEGYDILKSFSEENLLLGNRLLKTLADNNQKQIDPEPEKIKKFTR